MGDANKSCRKCRPAEPEPDPDRHMARSIEQDFKDGADPEFLVGSPDGRGWASFGAFGHAAREDAEAEAEACERRKAPGASWCHVVYRLVPVTAVLRGPDGQIAVTRLDAEAAEAQGES